MLNVKEFFKMVFKVDVTFSDNDVGTNVNLELLDENDEPVDTNIPIAIQTAALGVFMLWDKLGTMQAGHFLKFFDELLREVFETKLRLRLEKENAQGKGGEVIDMATYKWGGNDDGEIN